jgi:hypothetical protein
LHRGTFDEAVLDMNLRGETSEEVAGRLTGLRVPFLILNGYSTAQIAGKFPDAPVMAKPYNRSALISALQKLAKAGGMADGRTARLCEAKDLRRAKSISLTPGLEPGRPALGAGARLAVLGGRLRVMRGVGVVLGKPRD